MKIFLLTVLTMIAFAANSILNRMALTGGDIDPLAFSAVRLGSGAVVLMALLLACGRMSGVLGHARVAAVGGLTAYMVGFSVAYVALDAGTGALILFGGVQITMFIGAVLAGKPPMALQWVGAAIAFSGLVYLMSPAASAPDFMSAIMMIVAAIGWGLYSLIGQKATDPLAATGANFLIAMPLGILAWLVFGTSDFGINGVVLACLSGGITSALGYALWYKVLPLLQTGTAAIAQLSVPLIAAAAGVLFLAEPVTARFVVCAVLVLGGIGVSVFAVNRRS